MPSKDPARRLRDIVDMIDEIADYTEGMRDAEALAAERRSFRAVERCLLIIAEAATKLGQEAEHLCPTLPWQAIRSFGNAIRHEYDGIDAKRVWLTVGHNLPPLRAACLAALEKLGG